MDRGFVEHLDEPAINLCLYGFCASLESNLCNKSSSSSLVSIPNEVMTDLWLSSTSDAEKFRDIVCRVHREWVKSKLLCQDADVTLADKCIVIGCFVCVDYDKILMETGKFSDNIRATKMDSCMVLTECFSRRILSFRTSAINLIHSERVSAATSSVFAHRPAYSSHASMIMPKFWYHKYETSSLYFGPLLKRHLSFVLRTTVRLFLPLTVYKIE